MKVFNGIFKRTHRSLKQEFRKLYRLNQIFISKETKYVSNSQSSGVILPSDYEGPVTDVMPTSDPSITSDQQRIQQAMLLASRVKETKGLYDRYEVERAILKAAKAPSIDKVLPDPKGPNAVPPPKDPKVVIEEMKLEADKADRDLKFKMGLMQMMTEAELNQAKIKKLEAEAEAIQIGVATEGEKMRLNEINTHIALSRERRDGILQSISMMNDVYKTMVEGKKMMQESNEPKGE